MADGVAITAGSGTTILTDDCGASGHAQGVKLIVSANGDATPVPATAANGVTVDVTRVQGTVTVTNAGTFAVQVDGAALTALQLIDDAIFADDAAFTVGTSKVTVAGVLCVAHGSNPDAADALDAGAPLANRHRIPFHIGGHPNVVTYGLLVTTAVTDVVLGPTIGAGLKLVVTKITITIDNATTVFPKVTIGFGTANTPAFATTPGTVGVVAGHPGGAAGGGMNVGDGSGIIGIGADNEELRVTTVGTVGGVGMFITMTGYTIES